MEEPNQLTGRHLCIQDLPNEILDHIFSFLTIKERIRTEWVCHSWAEFSKNYKWSWPTKLDDEMIMTTSQIITDDIRSSVMSRCGISLKKLAMRVEYCKGYVSTKFFWIIGSNCSNLIEIVLDLREKPEDENSKWSWINVTKGCPKLEKLSLKLIDYKGDEASICLALKECKSLKWFELDCSSCSLPTFTAEQLLDSIKVPLKGFYIYRFYMYNDFPVIAKKLLSGNDPIEELGFGKLGKSYSDVLVHYNKTLKVLDLQYCQLRTSKLSEMFIMQKQLEVLSLKSSRRVDDQVMNILAANCKQLWAINISETNVSDDGLIALATLPNLTCLDASELSGITGKGLRQLASHGRLEIFNFVHILDLEEDENMIEESCMELVSCSPNLRLLDVRLNDCITERLVEHLFRVEC